jgi:pimeloyl-ACP methyl ester carboxylesterase
VGGWERWDAPQRIVRRIALKLRDRAIPGVHVETVENHKMALAEELVTRAFPDPTTARIVIYGNSLGGSATVRFARWLGERGYAVRLAVLIDSVGPDDVLIPANVASAVNFFQRDSWPVVGEPEIKAADPSRTKILGNYRFRYKGKSIDLETEPWVRRTFTKGHLQLEYDPEVWKLVEMHILTAIETPISADRPPAETRSSPVDR